MNHVGNHRFIVRGRRDGDGRRWPIHATNSRADAERVLAEGVTRDGRHWVGVCIHDRREALLPQGGWDA